MCGVLKTCVQGCCVAASAMEAAASSSSPTPQKGTSDNPITEGGDGSLRKSSVTAPLEIGPRRRFSKAVRQRRNERMSTTEREATDFLWEDMESLCVVGDVVSMVRPPTTHHTFNYTPLNLYRVSTPLLYPSTPPLHDIPPLHPSIPPRHSTPLGATLHITPHALVGGHVS